MMLNEIIRRAERETGGTVGNVIDCGDKWGLSFEEMKSEYDESEDEITRLLHKKTGSAHVLASKFNDDFRYCSDYDYIQSTRNGTEVAFAN